MTLPWHRGLDAAALLAAVTRQGFIPIALSPSAPRTLDELPTDRPLALFLGAEGPGLPEDLMRQMLPTRIAMSVAVDSLNVATSAAIVLHRLFAQRAYSAAS